MKKEEMRNVYLAFRYIEGICIAVFIFGFLWEGTEILKLTLPEFMMLYGASGAVVSEFLARLIHKYLKKKRKNNGEEKGGGNPQWIALAIGMALIVALLGGAIVLFETQAMWSMDSPNAQSWNATLNGTATFGFNIMPVFIVIIALCVIVGMMATSRGF